MIIVITNKSIQHDLEQFQNLLLLQPNRCVHDNGKEFAGWTFLCLLATCGIKDVCTAVRNPQANAICKKCTKQIGDIL